ncbi:MAG: DMT family transporter [Aquabacterium sp.]
MDAAGRSRLWLAAMPWVFVMIWSTGFIVARYGMPHAPPMTFLAWRYALSVVAFMVWLRLAQVPLPPRDQWAHLAMGGLLLHAGYLGGVWAAVRLGAPAGAVALVVGLQPLLTALWLRVNEGLRPMPLQWLGLAAGFVGVALVVWRRLQGDGMTPVNLALCALALVSITAGSLYQKRFVRPGDPRAANLIQLAAAFVVTWPLALLETDQLHWHPQLIGAMAWSVLVLTLGGSSLLILLIQRGAATQVASLMYLVPPGTALMAWALFGEALTPTVVAGMALAAVGVALVMRPTPPAG